jgi:enterochelin esterase family protein
MNVLRQSIISKYLKRSVLFDIYTPDKLINTVDINLLLINDGQDLSKMNFIQTASDLSELRGMSQLVSVGIHAGLERKQEYGVAGIPDYQKRGSKAPNYRDFIMLELIPFLNKLHRIESFNQKYLLGFSLGGLMAFDIAMDFQHEFDATGVFSGSFWWRSRALGEGYSDLEHRIIHKKVSSKNASSNQRFFFQTGKLDELADRNNNGIIDSIDDTVDLIATLENIGYQGGSQLAYLELEDGGHNLETWSRVMPIFFKWLLSEN